MRIGIFMLACLFFSLFAASCNPGCKGKMIYFGLIYANQGDTLKVFFDHKLIVNKVIEEDYIGHFKDQKDKLTTVCATRDSILTRVVINRRDTTFHILRKDINECYLGATISGNVKVYYNYVIDGFREYDPKR